MVFAMGTAELSWPAVPFHLFLQGSQAVPWVSRRLIWRRCPHCLWSRAGKCGVKKAGRLLCNQPLEAISVGGRERSPSLLSLPFISSSVLLEILAQNCSRLHALPGPDTLVIFSIPFLQAERHLTLCNSFISVSFFRGVKYMACGLAPTPAEIFLHST